MSRINARLGETLTRKLEEVRRVTGQSTTEVITQALDELHERLTSADGSAAHDAFERLGFVACAEGPKDLASRYKEHVDVSSKHGSSPAAATPRRARRSRR